MTIKLDTLLRYKIIEIVAYWEGRLTTNHLCQSFGIGRQQASKDINNYLTDIAPHNLMYDAPLKGYRPTSRFKPVFTHNNPQEYIQWRTDTCDGAAPFYNLAAQFGQTQAPGWLANLTPHPAQLSPHILSTLVAAITEKQAIETTYVSLNNPKPDPRIIIPHALVFCRNRWHVRAYCKKNGDFRDFVLTRFRGELKLLGDAFIQTEEDQYWNHWIKIKIVPDTRLSPAQRKIIAMDYAMSRNALMIETRAALAHYVLQQFNLDPQKIEAKPEAQQLMIANLKDVEKWLFG